MAKSKNNESWKRLFEKYQILDNIKNNGVFEISADCINEFRQARLMTKFDFSSQLPPIFQENHLAILPVTRGKYVIGDFEIFCKFHEDEFLPIINKTFPTYIQSIDFKDIPNETIAINAAYISGILNDFSQQTSLFPTLGGRMSSSAFSFDILNKNDSPIKIHVENSQLEIDGGFEGEDSIIIIEAKKLLADDFIIRQLYYPFRLIEKRTTKKVRPVFLTYSNGVFHLREYEFIDKYVYNSLELRNYKKYSIIDSVITCQDLEILLGSETCIPEPEGIPFPQADDFNRIINLCELINEKGIISKSELPGEFGIVGRQVDYYSNAAIYLGLVQSVKTDHSTCIRLTSYGKKLFDLSLKERQIYFIKCILAHRPFVEVLKRCLKDEVFPDKDWSIEAMKTTPGIQINLESVQTVNRRAQTVISWVKWVLSNIHNG